MMMMIGDYSRQHPTVEIPQWDHYDDSTIPIASATNTTMYSPSSTYSPTTPNFNTIHTTNLGPSSPPDYFAALQRYLPSNNNNNIITGVESDSDEFDLPPFDSFSCDNFRMFEFKVRKCARGRSHDWTECPFAHPGEKARRRDPRKYHYSGTSCPEFRKGQCKRGDACEYAHGVFECWLHPARYRTQPCKDGLNCKRRVCFFAHSPDQLRILPDSGCTEGFDSPTGRPGMESLVGGKGGGMGGGIASFVSSPTSILMDSEMSPPSESPPMSPSDGGGCYAGYGSNAVGELVAGMRGLQVGNGKGSCLSPRGGGCWGGGVHQIGSPSYGSPRSGSSNLLSLRQQGGQGLCSSPSPSTPTRGLNRSGLSLFESWDSAALEEEPAMERVESGRNLRAKIYGRLSKENSLD